MTDFMPRNPSKLLAGKIPARTECPYVNICDIKAMGECNHQGINHTMSFSCGVARAYDICHRYELSTDGRD